MKDLISYKGYLGSVHYSDTDDVFFGKIEGVDDLVTFEGRSVIELKASFHEAVDDYLALARAAGKPAEKSYRGSLNIRLKPDIHRRANRLALMKGKTLNQFISDAVEHEVQREKELV